MRKIFTLLTMLCLSVGASWAQADYEEIVGVKEVPTTALDFSSQSLTTGYYLIKQTNTACVNKGFLKATNEAAGAVVTATSVNPTPNATNEATYVWYVEVGDAGKFSIATANKKAAWQAPGRKQKNLVAYTNKATTLELNRTFAELNQTTQTLVKAVWDDAESNFEDGYSYVHESGGNLGSWNNHDTRSLFYLEFYPVSLEQLVLKDTRLPELTTNPETPILYSIKNLRGNAYAEYNGAGGSIQLQPSVCSVGGLFYFTAGSSEGTYKIHNYATTNKCAGVNSWTADGRDWYIKGSSNKDYNGLFISQTESASTNNDAWNDSENKHLQVAWYNGGDAGSVWKFEKFTGNVSDFDIKMSTESEKHLYFIKNDRVNKYANFEAFNSKFTEESNVDYGSYWYFVEKTDAENVPEGFKACYIYNAAYNLPVQNHTNGYMSAPDAATYPAKVYYVGIHESTYWGYVMHTGTNGWNDFDGSAVTDWNYNTDGSIWSLIPANKTAAQLTQEATTAKDNALTLIAAAEEADFYTYADDAIATAKAAVEAVDVTTLSGAVSSLLNATVSNAVTTLTDTDKGTTGPVAGQYILLKNKSKKQYMTTMEDGNQVHRTSDASEFKALWQVVAGEKGVKLYNPAKELYIGPLSKSAQVQMVSKADAQEFVFTNQAEVYGVFQNVEGTQYTFAHMDSWYDRVVGWEAVSDASQWIISEVTLEESLADLQGIYDVVNNAFGAKPGQYKEMDHSPSDELYTAWAFAKEVLGNDEAKDVYMMSKLASDLKAKWNTQLANPDSREINPPVQGKFYRLKNVASGRYMNVKSASSVVVTDEGNDLPATIFYLGENNTMLSYSVGQYLDCKEKNLSAVGTSKAGEFAAARSGAKPNTVMYMNNGCWTFGNRDNEVSIDKGSNKPGANEEGYDWTLEEIETLPVTITAAGYATLYAPVALEIPGGVKVYTAVKDDDSAYLNLQLVETGSIPANTGVILEADPGTYYFTVTDDDGVPALGTTNELTGAYPKSVKKQDRKVYTLQNGAYGVGFYLFKGENAQGATTYINGFRSWLELSSDAPAMSFRFKFGETTDIESLVTLQNAKAIYDLSGRRVENMDKGIYIVNGKKIVVK